MSLTPKTNAQRQADYRARYNRMRDALHAIDEKLGQRDGPVANEIRAIVVDALGDTVSR